MSKHTEAQLEKMTNDFNGLLSERRQLVEILPRVEKAVAS